MADINLTQAEADALIAMEKFRVDDTRWDYPGSGGSLSIPLLSRDKRENFLLDLSRGKIDLLKGSYQNRSRQVIILVRLDFGGQPHRDKWATPVPSDFFPGKSDLWRLLEDFMVFCHIIEPPLLQKGLFV
jgi:hypothetical protein